MIIMTMMTMMMMMMRLQRHLSSESTLSHVDNSLSSVPLCCYYEQHHISDHVVINHSLHNYVHLSITSTPISSQCTKHFSSQLCSAFPRRLFGATPDLQAVFNYYKIIFCLLYLYGSLYDTIPTSLLLLVSMTKPIISVVKFCIMLN